ncbi:spermidine/putrescine import ATP-binding protein potA [Anopheles sinensis]|uniref:Spermidine/putrescine import ATP-binding protein potA n=1 Tax=Anopheles sinensis TaxID=74873 RepID=A0A084WRJ2_ANOSI|nr:spermidine/putrescine import ATP-binding protein potA [Anopheles sinensis]
MESEAEARVSKHGLNARFGTSGFGRVLGALVHSRSAAFGTARGVDCSAIYGNVLLEECTTTGWRSNYPAPENCRNPFMFSVGIEFPETTSEACNIQT